MKYGQRVGRSQRGAWAQGGLKRRQMASPTRGKPRGPHFQYGISLLSRQFTLAPTTPHLFTWVTVAPPLPTRNRDGGCGRKGRSPELVERRIRSAGCTTWRCPDGLPPRPLAVAGRLPAVPDGVVRAPNEDHQSTSSLQHGSRIASRHAFQRRPARPIAVRPALPGVPDGVIPAAGEDHQAARVVERKRQRALPDLGRAPDRAGARVLR
jgi:hypothetical protein